MATILQEIIEHKICEVEARKQAVPIETLRDKAANTPPARDFQSYLRRGRGPVKLLAEIKAASPSSGTIRKDFDPARVAALYETCGAAAISVLTDGKYFAGSDEHLIAARAAVSLPVLRKDFTVDEYQLYESKAIGADAILLMAQVLDHRTYESLLRKAEELGLHVLAEGHTKEQIEFLVSIGAKTIGINNRDFETMTVDIETTLQRRDLIPSGRVVVSQSGIFHRGEVLRLENIGVDAIQVGTSIMKDNDIQQQIHRLLGIDT